MTSELPEPVRRLDRYLATARIAHEAIWELHNRLLAVDRYDEHAQEQLRHAGRIATDEIPALLRKARELSSTWNDQQLLERPAAEATAAELTADLDRVEATFRELRARQDEVARAFRSLLEQSE